MTKKQRLYDNFSELRKIIGEEVVDPAKKEVALEFFEACLEGHENIVSEMQDEIDEVEERADDSDGSYDDEVDEPEWTELDLGVGKLQYASDNLMITDKLTSFLQETFGCVI